jgi:taurine dioxygenase
MVKFTRLTGALGADVHGIDLSQPPSSDTIRIMREGLLEHQVLFFREQKILSTEQHMALARHFGELEPTPFRRKDSNAPSELLVIDQYDPTGSTGANFHADNTFRPTPPMGALLQAHVLPERGGDTCFASMYAAYDALSPHMQSYLEGLEAVHNLQQQLVRIMAGDPSIKLNLDLSEWPPMKHPIIAVHPETGRKLLFVNYNWTTHIDGIPTKESETILKYLYEHIRSPEFQVRLHWNVGDIAFWDNRVTQHHAVADYKGRRNMQRVSILGTRPQSVRDYARKTAAE